MTDATALLGVWMDPAPEREDDLNRWYEEEHLADRLSMPGWLTARRYRSLEGAHKYVALYDLENLAALHSPKYTEAQKHSTPWTRQVVDNLRGFQRTEYELLQSIGQSPEGGAPYALFVRLETDDEHDAELNEWYEQEHLPALAGVPGCVAARRYRRAADTGGSPKYFMIYEASSREAIRGEAWRKAAETEWTLRMRPHFRNRMDNIVELIRSLTSTK
jgi:hypothetical protein